VQARRSNFTASGHHSAAPKDQQARMEKETHPDGLGIRGQAVSARGRRRARHQAHTSSRSRLLDSRRSRSDPARSQARRRHHAASSLPAARHRRGPHAPPPQRDACQEETQPSQDLHVYTDTTARHQHGTATPLAIGTGSLSLSLALSLYTYLHV